MPESDGHATTCLILSLEKIYSCRWWPREDDLTLVAERAKLYVAVPPKAVVHMGFPRRHHVQRPSFPGAIHSQFPDQPHQRRPHQLARQLLDRKIGRASSRGR